MGPPETCAMTDTKLKRIAWLSARWRHAFTGRTGIKPWASMGSVLTQSNVNGFVLSLLPELGTMGSKWGGAWATGSSTSLNFWKINTLYVPELIGSLSINCKLLKLWINSPDKQVWVLKS